METAPRNSRFLSLVVVERALNIVNTKKISFEADYDRAKAPLNKVQNKGTQGVQARNDTELPPFISIVRHPGQPIILGMDNSPKHCDLSRHLQESPGSPGPKSQKSLKKVVLGVRRKFPKISEKV